MARYFTTKPSDDFSTFTVNYSQLDTLLDVVHRLYLMAVSERNDTKIIELLNTIPTAAAEFKQTSVIGAVTSGLLGFLVEADNNSKGTMVKNLENGFNFVFRLWDSWDNFYPTMKFNAPMAHIIDTVTGKETGYVAGEGYIVSKTDRNGITITF
ncbi:MAG TPA: hypothetical protein VNR38_06175 [Ureibacillus sp.]|nr:hypothetical protein [Ureibacillus sp.]